MEFIVESYHYEPFSASIWRLKVPSLDIIVQCVEPLGRDFGDIVKDSAITGNLILEMAQVSPLVDANVAPCFSIVKDNFNLSDGSRVRCVGIAGNIHVDDNEFKLASIIEISVQAEVLPNLYEGNTVEVIGILKFKPNGHA